MKAFIALILLLPFIYSADLVAQKSGKKITITGSVLDANNFPVSGAIIMIDGKNTGSTTDRKGYFKVKVKSSAVEIGVYSPLAGVVEEPINNRVMINIVLDKYIGIQPGNVAVTGNEETVNIGYGTVKKENLTDPVNRIEGSDKNFAAYANIFDMIKGRVPNVEVNGNSIRIQGSSSFIGASTEPLLVVDGMVVSSIDDIVPQQVKSIEVLKGSSASIYGSRGANGVILIRLKTAADIK